METNRQIFASQHQTERISGSVHILTISQETILGDKREMIVQFNSDTRSQTDLTCFSGITIFDFHETNSSSSVQEQTYSIILIVRPTDVRSNSN